MVVSTGAPHHLVVSGCSVVNAGSTCTYTWVVGSHVSELSGEFALALEMGARLDDIAGTIHVHPTLTEAFAESALASLGHAIHISN